MSKLVLSFHDPRYPKPTRRSRGNLNCDRYAVIDGRIFRVSKSCGSWTVEELETPDSMVNFDETVAFACLTLDEARAAIAKHLAEWPTETREEHYQRLRAWNRSKWSGVAR